MLHHWYWVKLFNMDQVKLIVKDIESKLSLASHEHDHILPTYKNTTSTRIFPYNKLDINYRELIDEKIEFINSEIFGFEIYTKQPSYAFVNWYNFKNKADYDLHLDMHNLGSLTDIKLTAILNLSTDSYEGGEFAMQFNNTPTIINEINESGTLLVFPSFFLHKVFPVTKGTRISMSLWMKGPHWK